MTDTSKNPKCPKCDTDKITISTIPGLYDCLVCRYKGPFRFFEGGESELFTDTSKKPREIWIRDEPNSVSWESLVGTQNYWGDRGICFVKKEDYQSLKEQCEKLAEALEKISKTKYGLQGYVEENDDEGAFDYMSNLCFEYEKLARQALAEFKKFKGEL